jgi:hypothetical protein
MGHDRYSNAKWIWPGLVVAATTLTVVVSPALAQHAAGQASAGHMIATHPMAPARSMSTVHSMPTNRSIAPSRFGATPMHGGQQIGGVRPNSFGASSAPPPSWELPKNVTPHWEIGPNVQVQPNPVQGNRIPHNRGGFGVGYVGFPYYADPMAFVNADTGDDTGTEPGQQAQPAAPAPPDYAQQAPYAEGPYNQGYPPPPRAPYNSGDNPGAYPPPPQNSAQSTAAQSDGLDHPAVTLVFNDGRPPMKVHSYVLTGSSVFVAESGHQRVIPVADLDLAATVAQNREAGVEFQLPGGSR